MLIPTLLKFPRYYLYAGTCTYVHVVNCVWCSVFDFTYTIGEIHTYVYIQSCSNYFQLYMAIVYSVLCTYFTSYYWHFQLHGCTIGCTQFGGANCAKTCGKQPLDGCLLGCTVYDQLQNDTGNGQYVNIGIFHPNSIIDIQMFFLF